MTAPSPYVEINGTRYLRRRCPVCGKDWMTNSTCPVCLTMPFFAMLRACPVEPDEPKAYWGPDGRCVHCGAGNDAHHSYTCPTNLHPDKREPDEPKAIDTCPLCGVRGWVESSLSWGTRHTCRACKGTFTHETDEPKAGKEGEAR